MLKSESDLSEGVPKCRSTCEKKKSTWVVILERRVRILEGPTKFVGAYTVTKVCRKMIERLPQ